MTGVLSWMTTSSESMVREDVEEVVRVVSDVEIVGVIPDVGSLRRLSPGLGATNSEFGCSVMENVTCCVRLIPREDRDAIERLRPSVVASSARRIFVFCSSAAPAHEPGEWSLDQLRRRARCSRRAWKRACVFESSIRTGSLLLESEPRGDDSAP